MLFHLPPVLHICVSELDSTGSGNGLSPVRRQAITWANDVLLSIRPLATNFCEILIEIQNSSFRKMHLKTLFAKWQPFWPGEMSSRSMIRYGITGPQWVQATYCMWQVRSGQRYMHVYLHHKKGNDIISPWIICHTYTWHKWTASQYI